MPTNPLGSGVSRTIDNRDRSFAAVVFEEDSPPLDSEMNLISLMDLESRAEEVRSRVASGWLMNESGPRPDFVTSPTYSNRMYFGRQQSGEVRNISWAVVNGWPIPVAGTKTGLPPLAANDIEYWNRIDLNPPSTSTGGNRAELVFLEAWLERIDVDPPLGTSPGKPIRGYIYKFGNVEGGFSYLPDDLLDPDINYETSKRVQIQYRIRVVPDINLIQNPEGFDPSLVFAQGALSVPSAEAFANMREELGDPGLWRAGDGDPANLGTVDGYVYAVPICVVFRRNSAGFSDVGNLAGAFDRNSVATTREDATTYTAGIALQSDIDDVTTSFHLTSIAGTVLETMSSFGDAFFKLGDEIVRVTVPPAQLGPTDFVVTIARAQLGTSSADPVSRYHVTGTPLVQYTQRPDGLFADQIASTDVLDLRHSVADKFDYDSVLRTGVFELLRGSLRTTWKRYGSTNSAGAVVLYGDRITDTGVGIGGLSQLDAPDGNRRVFSDAVTFQRFDVPIVVPDNGSSLLDDLATAVRVAPYDVGIQWIASPPVHIPGNRFTAGGFPSWWNGDQIRVNIADFRTGVSGSDSDQIRFLSPGEAADCVLVRFEGMTTDPNGGVNAPANAPTVTNPNLPTPVAGNLILRDGEGISVTTDVSGNLLIELVSGTVDTAFQEFLDAMQSATDPAYAAGIVMHVELTVAYGAGRGLSHKPDFVHTVQYNGGIPEVLSREGLSGTATRMIPTYLGDSPLVQTGNDRQYARTSEVMFDPGSKTVYVAPYRKIVNPALLTRVGDQLNWYAGPTYQGGMPALSQDGGTTVHADIDPLTLFYGGPGGGVTLYVEPPMDMLPKPGLHHVPILASANATFSQGLNFFLMSKEGTVLSTSDYNPNLVSYPVGSPGYYIVTPHIGETYGTSSGLWSMFGQKTTVNKLRADSGGPFRGIRLPPFLGPARITGVYVRHDNDVVPVSSPFNNDRVFVGGLGTDVNLLRTDYDGPTLLIDVDVNGDATFVLNADALDYSRVPGASFDSSDFLVECTVFGFDRGFLQTNARLIIARSTGAGGSFPTTVNYTVTDFTTSGTQGVGLVVPAPLESGSANNEITFFYSRVPYQGDVFGTQSAMADDPQRLGPLTIGEASSLASHPLGPVSTLALPFKSGYEVLSATSWITSLGTGRLSGSVPLPLLDSFSAPANPPDFAGTRVDLARRFSVNRVGYEAWTDIRFPVVLPDPPARPDLAFGAMSEIFDNDAHPEFSGCVSRLPLGAWFRDKDFVGKTLYQARSTAGVGSIPIGALSFVPYEASMAKGSSGVSTWEGTEFVCGSSSNTSGAGSETLVRVDGTSNVNSVDTFKTTRGGAAYSATGPWTGGVITSRFPKARPNSEVGSVLMCTAFLVRSQPESSNTGEVHPGNELQMVVVTQAAPAYFRDNEIVHSASGAGEGFTAVDRFRLSGKPLEKRRGKIDLLSLPADKPLFVNKIYDDPVFYGSSDLPMITPESETLAISVLGQTAFSLSLRPLDPSTVQIFLNGVKLAYGVDYTIDGATNQDVTYLANPPTLPDLLVTDDLEAWYIAF